MIRPATDADIPHLVESSRSHYRTWRKPGMGVFDAGIAWVTLEAALADEDQAIFTDDEHSGWVWMSFYPSPCSGDTYAGVRAWLTDIPGRGGLLMRRAIREAQARKATLLTAHTELQGAASALRRLGFSEEHKTFVRLLA